jgi:cell division septal protein FtsQ
VVVRETGLAAGRAGVLRLPAGRAALRRQAARLLPSRRGVLVAAAVLSALPLVAWAARTGPFFLVRSIETEGAPPALAREIRAQLQPLIGRSLLALDGDEVVGRVEALPQVAHASYDRSFPQTLVVRVRREVARAVLRQGRSSWLVSGRGRVIRSVARGSRPHLPRVWLGRSAAPRPGTMVSESAARRALQALDPLRVSPLPLAVHSVDARGRLTFRLARGIELRLGDASDLALKLAVAARVLEALTPRGSGKPLFLDVSVPERPVAGSHSQLADRG